MRKTVLVPVVAWAMVVGCGDPTGRLVEPGPEGPALAAAPAGQVGRFIVVLDDAVADPAALTDALAAQAGAAVHFRYRAALRGFAASIPAAALDGLRRNPLVRSIEPDGIATIGGTQTNPPSWGLDRIDQRALPLNASYQYENGGEGVRAYILDTGIRFDHQEFAGRATSGYDFIDNDADASDCHGHGTHVAGTVGGTAVGVAKNVALVAVRVLNCQGSGSYSQVIAGIDWVTANAVKPAVANMSLGGVASAAVNTAVANSIAAGVVYAVAAGNENTDACTRSPASTPAALTVAATTSADARASFSNYGTCVDLFAPGSAIYSSTQTGTGTYASWSGTSMAAPHVAGVAALYLSAHPAALPADVEAVLKGAATAGVVTGAGSGSPNLLLYSLVAGGAPPPPPPPGAVVHVAGMSGSAAPVNRNTWRATVTITVVDAGGAPVAGATVAGAWSGGTSGSGSCVTSAAGTCAVMSSNVNTRKGPVTFRVNGISGSGLVYDPAANVVSSVTVNAP